MRRHRQEPVVRIVTDEGISGFGEVKQYKPDLKRSILHFCEALIGQDPTNVERVMLRIRQRGAFKPWGSAVSAIEMALWDVAGKAAGVPVYKLLDGKVPRPCLRLQRPLAPAASRLRARARRSARPCSRAGSYRS